MRKIILTILVCWLVSGIPVFAQEKFSPFKGRITDDDVNIRTDSTINAETICKLSRDEAIYVINQRYDWYKVKLPLEAPAFIKKELVGLTEGGPEKLAEISANNQTITNPEEAVKAKILKEVVNIRLKPDLGAPIIGKAKSGKTVLVVKEFDDWFQVLPTNSFGWLHKKFVKKEQDLPVEFNAEQDIDVINQEVSDKDHLVITGQLRSFKKLFRKERFYKLVSVEGQEFLITGEKEKLEPFTNYQKIKIVGKLIPTPGEKIPVVGLEKIEAIN